MEMNVFAVTGQVGNYAELIFRMGFSIRIYSSVTSDETLTCAILQREIVFFSMLSILGLHRETAL
jgi:hypothetical protein